MGADTKGTPQVLTPDDMRTNDYARRKEQAREQAKEWQRRFSDGSHSWAELSERANYFERLARRYGLLTEFRENGII